MAYLIDGRDAAGDAYIDAIDSLPDNDLKYVDVGTRNNRLRISTWPGGLQLLHYRPDGSSWVARRVLNKDEVKILVAGFLTNRNDWTAQLDWEQVEVTSREARYRTVRILLMAVIAVVLALLLVKLIGH